MINDDKKSNENKENMGHNIKEIYLEYKNKEEKNIKIFGQSFVINNKQNCKIIYKGKEYELSERFGNIDFKEDILKIKLSGIEKITNLDEMFYECKYFIKSENISKLDTTKITSMSKLFSNCNLLTSLPDISNWNMINVTNISWMFYGCSSLLSLPDISKWNTSNITNINYLFNRCESLLNLPDIS